MSRLKEAAYARKSGVRAPADRPSQRRSAEARGSLAVVTVPLSRIEVRGLDDPTKPLIFEGFASVTEREYEMWDMFGPYDEIVHLGAFAQTLAQTEPPLDVPLVLGHDSMRRIARTVGAESTLHLEEVMTGDVTGLHTLAPNLDRNDPDVAYIAPKLASGLTDEMSFKFFIVSGRWSDDWMTYHIHAVDIHRGDVSIVGYGANPHTSGAGLRSRQDSTGTRSANYYRTLIDLNIA